MMETLTSSFVKHCLFKIYNVNTFHQSRLNLQSFERGYKATFGVYVPCKLGIEFHDLLNVVPVDSLRTLLQPFIGWSKHRLLRVIATPDQLVCDSDLSDCFLFRWNSLYYELLNFVTLKSLKSKLDLSLNGVDFYNLIDSLSDLEREDFENAALKIEDSYFRDMAEELIGRIILEEDQNRDIGLDKYLITFGFDSVSRNLGFMPFVRSHVGLKDVVIFDASKLYKLFCAENPSTTIKVKEWCLKDLPMCHFERALLLLGQDVSIEMTRISEDLFAYKAMDQYHYRLTEQRLNFANYLNETYGPFIKSKTALRDLCYRKTTVVVQDGLNFDIEVLKERSSSEVSYLDFGEEPNMEHLF